MGRDWYRRLRRIILGNAVLWCFSRKGISTLSSTCASETRVPGQRLLVSEAKLH